MIRKKKKAKKLHWKLTLKTVLLKVPYWNGHLRSTSLSRSGSPTRERALNESLRMAELQVEFYFVKKRQSWNWRMDATTLQQRILKKWRGSEIILNVACHVQNREYGVIKKKSSGFSTHHLGNTMEDLKSLGDFNHNKAL